MAEAGQDSQEFKAGSTQDKAHVYPSPRLLSCALNSSNDAIVGIDMDQRVILWNDAAARRYGLDPEDAIGKPLREIYDFGFLSEADEADAFESLEREGAWRGRCVHTLPDGTHLSVDAAVTVMRDDEGSPIGQFAVMRDVDELIGLEAEREKALADLSLEQRRLRTIIDAIPMAIGLSDANGRVLELNAGVEALWRGRYLPEDVDEYRVYRAWWPCGEEVKPTEWTTARVLETGEPIYDDLIEIERFDGTHAMVVSSGVPIYNERGELDGVIGYIQDASERYQRSRLNVALNEIGSILHSALDSEELFEVALEKLRTSLAANTCGIALREMDKWRVKAVVGSHASRLGKLLDDEELATATAVLASGVTEMGLTPPLDECGEEEDSLVVTTPLTAREQTVGVLSVIRSKLDFEPAEVDFIEHAASAIALALENARLFAGQIETAKLNAALVRITATLHAELDFDVIMERALSYGSAALQADSAFVGWRLDGGMRIGFVHGLPRDLIGRELPAQCDRHGAEAADLRNPIVISDTEASDLMDPEYLEEFGFRSLIVAPIIMRGEPVATLYFHHSQARHEYSDAEESFVRNLSSSLSLALDNSALFREQRERGMLADSLNRIDAAINSTLDFDVALEVALPVAMDALRVDSMLLLESCDGVWKLRHAVGVTGELEGVEFGDETLRAGREALETKDVVSVEDVVASGRMSAHIAERFGVRAALVAPLVHANATSGLIYFNDHQAPRQWQAHELDFVSAFGAHLSLAAENARLFSVERERASLNEALAEIDTLIHGSSVFVEWMGRALEMVAVSIGADSAGLFVRENRRWTARFEYGFGDDYLGYAFSDQEAEFMQQITPEGGPFVIEHPDDKPDTVEWRGRRYEFASNVVAPLLDRGRVFGVLIFNADTHARFKKLHVEFVRKFAASVALGLENQRLYEEEQRSAASARALNSVNEVLLSTLSVEEMFERIVERVSTAAGADVAVLLRPDGDDWVITSVHRLPDDLQGRRLSLEAQRIVRHEARRRRPVLISDIPDDVRGLVEREAGLTDSRSLMLLPLRANGELIGVVIFGYLKRVEFGSGEREFAERMSTAVTLALENARLFQAERHIAETLQDTLLVVPHRIPGIDFARIYRPATTASRVGGDFIDAFQLTNRRVGLALGDVSGKGLKAASATAMVRNTLRAHAVEALPPSVIAEKTGNVLSLFTAPETFVTAFFGTLDTRTGCLDYVNAGHPPALVLAADGTLHTLDTRSPVLGAFPGVTYRDGRHIMLPGDCLFVYSDGLIEARVDGKLFGEARLAELLPRFAGASPEELVNGVFEAVNEFTHGDFRDDVALLAVSRRVQHGTEPSEEFGMLF